MHSDAKLISENWRIVWRKIQGLKPTARSGQITKDAEKGLILTIFDQKRVLDDLFDPRTVDISRFLRNRF